MFTHHSLSSYYPLTLFILSGFDAKTVDMEDFDSEKLKETGAAIFLLATYGEGEPTDNAAAFLKFLKNEDASVSVEFLSGLRYCVFGLGEFATLICVHKKNICRVLSIKHVFSSIFDIILTLNLQATVNTSTTIAWESPATPFWRRWAPVV